MVFSSIGYTVIAFAMYYFTYDPWIGKLLYLEDFYVMQEFRGKVLDKCCYMAVIKVNKLQRKRVERHFYSHSHVLTVLIALCISNLSPGLGIGSQILKALSEVRF